MWSAYLRAPSASALEALADAVQAADYEATSHSGTKPKAAVPIPPRAAFPPLLKALTAKSTHAHFCRSAASMLHGAGAGSDTNHRPAWTPTPQRKNRDGP